MAHCPKDHGGRGRGAVGAPGLARDTKELGRKQAQVGS